MRLIDLIARHPRIAAACALIAAIAALPFAARIQVDNSIEVWIDQDSVAYRNYQEFLEEFGSEEFLLLVYDLPAPLDDDFLLELTDLRFDLEEIDGVRFAIDLSSLRGKFFSGAGAEGFEREVRGSPFYRDFLISRNGGMTATWLVLDIREPTARTPIVESVEAVLRNRWPDREVHLAGTPALNAALDRSSRRASRTLFPFVFAVSGLVLIYRFRQLLGLVVPFVSVGAGIAMTLALMELAGGALDMVTSALPSVVWILGLSTSIHLFSSYRRHVAAGEERDAAALGAMREVARPCLFSAITTALGFLALVASAMQPVREIGLFAPIGVLLCLGSNFLLFPLLVRLGHVPFVPPAEPDAESSTSLWETAVARVAAHRPAVVLGTAVALALLLGVGVTRIRAESNVVEFFKKSAPVARTYRQILPELTGAFSLELLLSPPGEVVTLETFRELERLEALVAAVPGVAKTLSPVDLLKKMHQGSTGAPPSSWELPLDDDFFSLAWDMTSANLEEELGMLFHADGVVRVSLLVRPMDSDAHQRLVTTLRELLSREADPEWRPRLTGIVDLLIEMQTELVRSQIRSFVLAFLLISPVIALLLRSPRYALLSAPPNLLPILVALGTMGAFSIRLDPATVMIAAMALGIAVDDTIHFLTHYQSERASGLEPLPAIERTFAIVAEPIADTTSVAAAGFLVLTLSDFVPLIYFGLLTSLTLVTALLADLLVLPALLAVFDRKR